MGATIMFGWPAIFYVGESWNFSRDNPGSKHPATASLLDLAICALLCVIVVPLFSVGGRSHGVFICDNRWEFIS